MSFWKTFGFHTVSAIETLLDAGDFTLDQLLDEEEILQETKSQNKKLIEFLTQPETLKQLLIYITEEPETKEDDSEDSKRRFKYPFLACEILASEVWSIIDAFFAQKELLERLYGYFDNEPPLNPLLSSYTSRVAGIFLQKKVSNTIDFLKQRTNIIETFLKHVGNASVMDLLLKIIACEDTTEGSGVLQWLCTTNLISSLINKFDPKNSSEVHENAAQALVDIITVSMNSSDSPLIAQLESEEMMKVFFGYILSQGLSSSLLNGVAVLIELLRRHIRDQYDDTTTLDQLPPFLRIIISHLDQFHAFLKRPEQPSILPQPIGDIEPLGFHRLRIIEFFASLQRTNYACINNEVIRVGGITACLELFFAHMWNNFLHATVEQMISQILEGENDDLKVHLLTNAGLLERICKASQGNEEDLAKNKGVRRGYMGHLTSISITIMNTSAINPKVEKILQESEQWNKYVKGALATTRERESKIIGGYMPTDFNAEDDDIDDRYDGGGYSADIKLDDDDDDDDDDDTDDDDDENPNMDDNEEGQEEKQQPIQDTWEEKQIQDAPMQEDPKTPENPEATTTTNTDAEMV